MKSNTLSYKIGDTVWITQKYCANDKQLWHGKIIDLFKNDNDEDAIEIHCGLHSMLCRCSCECSVKNLSEGVYLSKKDALNSFKSTNSNFYQEVVMSDWILCSIESPSESQKVLLTFKNSAGTYVGEAIFKKDGYYYVAETPNGKFEELYGIPVAWMKIPEPYSSK